MKKDIQKRAEYLYHVAHVFRQDKERLVDDEYYVCIFLTCRPESLWQIGRQREKDSDDMSFLMFFAYHRCCVSVGFRVLLSLDHRRQACQADCCNRCYHLTLELLRIILKVMPAKELSTKIF